MSKTQSRKRLVSREEYFQILRKKSTLYSLAGAAGGFGLFCMLVAASNAWYCLLDWNLHFYIVPYFLWNGCLAAFGFATIVWGRFAFQYTREMEAITLITRHNTSSLPEVETLVRGSTQPLTEHQAELLRAVGHETETPPEQLLRATQEVRQGM